jgi:hypothetical protein
MIMSKLKFNYIKVNGKELKVLKWSYKRELLTTELKVKACNQFNLEVNQKYDIEISFDENDINVMINNEINLKEKFICFDEGWVEYIFSSIFDFYTGLNDETTN